MNGELILPEGVEKSVLSGADVMSRWAGRSFAPLEVVLDTVLETPVRLAAPTQVSWASGDGEWVPLRREEVVAAMGSTVLRRGRLLLIERARPDAVIAELATVSDQPLGDCLQWLGWPRLVGAELPVLISERLRNRSNDYWVLDLAMAALELCGPDRVTGPPVLPGVSVVIPARDVHDTLADTVRAIEAAAAHLPAGTPWECVVVDDLSEPPLVLPEGASPSVRILRPSQRVYCGGGRNLGTSQVRYPVVVFIDADTQMAPNYLLEHGLRHLLSPNLITVSLREALAPGAATPARLPDGSRDTRSEASYKPGRLGLVPVTEPVTVRPLEQTRQFHDFGYGRLLGPADLAFMVKGNNFVVSSDLAQVGCPPDFVGYGPEDGTYAAKVIARGAFVVPVLDTGVFHRDHPPRSGSFAARDAELIPNLRRQAFHLDTPADGPWVVGTQTDGGSDE